MLFLLTKPSRFQDMHSNFRWSVMSWSLYRFLSACRHVFNKAQAKEQRCEYRHQDCAPCAGGVLPLLRSSSRTGSKCQLGLGGAALARPLLGSPPPGKLRRWQQQLLLLRLSISICPGRPQTNGDTNLGVSNQSANIMSWRVMIISSSSKYFYSGKWRVNLTN